MEDVRREDSDYYLDTETLAVVEVPLGLLKEAEGLLYEEDSEYEFGVVYDSAVRTEAELGPEHEGAIEMALEVLTDPSRYVRIPERPSWHAYQCMRAFAMTLKGPMRERLLRALQGRGAFRRFKSTLKEDRKLYKAWNAYNAKAMQRLIDRWLRGVY